MDYKTKLQTNNTELANNNIDLQAILNTINTLPEAGGGGTDTSDATATSADILDGKTAYGADGKLTGTFSLDEEITAQEAVIAQIQTALENKTASGGGVEVPLVTVNCSINPTYQYSYILDLSYLTFEEGTIVEKTISFTSAESTTITMLKNSCIRMSVMEGEMFAPDSPLFATDSFISDSELSLPIHFQAGGWYSAIVYIDKDMNATISF